MQFATTLTEYILAGLPLTVAFTYLSGVLASKLGSYSLSLAALHASALAAIGIGFLCLAYVTGVLAHAVARGLFKQQSTEIELKTWESYGRYALPHLGVLGKQVEEELEHKDEDGNEDKGWILWRMRFFVLHHSEGCGGEILRLQAVSRAARAAIMLLPALAIGLIAGIIQAFCCTAEWDSTCALQLILWALLVVLFMSARRIKSWMVRVYRYRWGVVCRASIAAFLSCASHLAGPTTPTSPRQE